MTISVLRTLFALLLIYLCCCFSQRHCLQIWCKLWLLYHITWFRPCCLLLEVGCGVDPLMGQGKWLMWTEPSSMHDPSVLPAQTKARWMASIHGPLNVSTLSYCSLLSILINGTFCRFRSVYVFNMLNGFVYNALITNIDQGHFILITSQVE